MASPGRSGVRTGWACAWHWLVLMAFLPCMASGATAQTPERDGDVNIAGLVIDYGDGRTSYALVPFTEESLSGIELLRRSGLTLVTVPFGGLGEGVCSIESTGCGIGDCRARMCQSADRESPFWQYLRQGNDGTWAPAALGASQAEVRDGDVDAWVWTGTPPDLPSTSVASLWTRLDVPSDWQAAAGSLPEPIVLTEGEPAVGDSNTTGWRQVIPGMAVIAGVGLMGWVLIGRTRRRSLTGDR